MAVEIWRTAEKSPKPLEFCMSDFLKVGSGKKEKPESGGPVGIHERNLDPISTSFTTEANHPVLFSSILCKFGMPPLVIGFSAPPEIHTRFLPEEQTRDTPAGLPIVYERRKVPLDRFPYARHLHPT